MAKQVENMQTVDVGAMIDQLVANAEKSLEEYMSMTQEQVDGLRRDEARRNGRQSH